MQIEIKIPSIGESVKEAVLVQWYKQSGDRVLKDEAILMIETDKVALEIVAESDGLLTITVPEGKSAAVGTVVGFIDTEAVAAMPEKPEPSPTETEAPLQSPSSDFVSRPEGPFPPGEFYPPSVRRLIAEKKIDASKIGGTGPGGRITKGDILLYLEKSPKVQKPAHPGDLPLKSVSTQEEITRKAMTPIRKRIAARLLESKQNTAMLTTFNEIDMSRAMAIRNQYKDIFQKKHGLSLGFMSFFVKACVEALKEIPEINAFIEGGDIVYHHYCHIGVAIGAERGLVVPVIRHADKLGFAGIEKAILDYVAKIKENRLELADLEGGTFTVSNGGVYGSLLSTPILNIPQSGILGMHKIEKRPVVIDDEIVVRPMMYVALSYDHRIVDGREAVTFLKRIKECVENPERMLMEI